ncbi:MAG: hypothetical protein Q7U75_14735 [Desulfobacterales bacterium]|nr:hypothetical protein [Desulfobacterales bacterium]
MPYKSRLIQAIRDEETKLFQQQAWHIVGPGVVVLTFSAIAGWFAVRVVRAPEMFGGGTFEQIGYGIVGVAIALWLTKGYTTDKWLDAWLRLGKAHQEKVARIEAVMAKLEQDELARTGDAPAQADDPWKRALATAPAAKDGATETP